MFESELEEMEGTIGKGMKGTIETLKLLRSPMIRKKFPRMSEAFEADLEDAIRGNPYKPSTGGRSYKDEGEGEEEAVLTPKVRTESGKRVGVSAEATLKEIVNPMRARYSMAPAKLKKRVES